MYLINKKSQIESGKRILNQQEIKKNKISANFSKKIINSHKQMAKKNKKHK